jgi:hypothetical protein
MGYKMGCIILTSQSSQIGKIEPYMEYPKVCWLYMGFEISFTNHLITI